MPGLPERLEEFAATLRPGWMVNHAVLVVQFVSEDGDNIISQISTERAGLIELLGLLNHARVLAEHNIVNSEDIIDPIWDDDA